MIRDATYPDDSPDGIECRSLCIAVSNPTKRGLGQLEPRNVLVKRVFDPWPSPQDGDDARNEFMTEACNALTPDQEIVPRWAQKSPGYASAVTAPFGTTAFRFGMHEICGCTMLYVVSRKRVYLGNCLQTSNNTDLSNIRASGHYWEDVSFGKSKKDTHKLQYDEQVTNFLTNGFKAPGGPGKPSTRLFIFRG